MNRFFNKSIALIALVGAMTAFSTSKAEAAFTAQICNDALCAGGDDMSFTDADLNGIISSGAVSAFGYDLLINTSQSKPFLASGMDLQYTVGIGANSPVPATAVWFFATDTGFMGTPSLSAKVGGTMDGASVVNATACLTPGACASSGDISTGGAYSAAWAVGAASGSPYTLALGVKVSGLGAGQTVTGDFRVVPEPAALALLGLGLMGVAARRRRTV